MVTVGRKTKRAQCALWFVKEQKRLLLDERQDEYSAYNDLLKDKSVYCWTKDKTSTVCTLNRQRTKAFCCWTKNKTSPIYALWIGKRQKRLLLDKRQDKPNVHFDLSKDNSDYCWTKRKSLECTLNWYPMNTLNRERTKAFTVGQKTRRAKYALWIGRGQKRLLLDKKQDEPSMHFESAKDKSLYCWTKNKTNPMCICCLVPTSELLLTTTDLHPRKYLLWE